ncbi:hypothetical protein EON67_06090 [archaeon]|nr:MAG: hypothetical protein EON67_06090 [archaeon]
MAARGGAVRQPLPVASMARSGAHTAEKGGVDFTFQPRGYNASAISAGGGGARARARANH